MKETVREECPISPQNLGKIIIFVLQTIVQIEEQEA